MEPSSREMTDMKKVASLLKLSYPYQKEFAPSRNKFFMSIANVLKSSSLGRPVFFPFQKMVAKSFKHNH